MFSGLASDQPGGAVYLKGTWDAKSFADIADCRFAECQAGDNATSQYGGGMYIIQLNRLIIVRTCANACFGSSGLFCYAKCNSSESISSTIWGCSNFGKGEGSIFDFDRPSILRFMNFSTSIADGGSVIENTGSESITLPSVSLFVTSVLCRGLAVIKLWHIDPCTFELCTFVNNSLSSAGLGIFQLGTNTPLILRRCLFLYSQGPLFWKWSPPVYLYVFQCQFDSEIGTISADIKGSDNEISYVKIVSLVYPDTNGCIWVALSEGQEVSGSLTNALCKTNVIELVDKTCTSDHPCEHYQPAQINPNQCCVFRKCSFFEMHYDSDGGVITFVGSAECSGLVTYCQFASCTSNAYGGALFMTVGRLTVIDSCAAFCRAVVGTFLYANCIDDNLNWNEFSGNSFWNCSNDNNGGVTLRVCGAFELRGTNFSKCAQANSAAILVCNFAQGETFPMASSFVTCVECSGEFGFDVTYPLGLSFDFFVMNKNTNSVGWYRVQNSILVLRNCLFARHTGQLFQGNNYTLSECQFSDSVLDVSLTLAPVNVDNEYDDTLTIRAFASGSCYGLYLAVTHTFSPSHLLSDSSALTGSADFPTSMYFSASSSFSESVSFSKSSIMSSTADMSKTREGSESSVFRMSERGSRSRVLERTSVFSKSKVITYVFSITGHFSQSRVFRSSGELSRSAVITRAFSATGAFIRSGAFNLSVPFPPSPRPTLLFSSSGSHSGSKSFGPTVEWSVAAKSNDLLRWVIPVTCVLAALLVIAIVIAIIAYRKMRRQREFAANDAHGHADDDDYLREYRYWSRKKVQW
jgi:hypothetical protein